MKDNHEATVKQEVERVFIKRPHVVLLGAGASRATTLKGDKNKKILPLMQDIIQVIGLGDLIPEDLDTENFELVYDSLFHRKDKRKNLGELEKRVRDYFSSIQIPDEPTIYDHLVLSLRETDLLATFNWDPLLTQAYVRNAHAGSKKLPKLAFLHGNVLTGVCYKDKVTGKLGNPCSVCRKPLKPVPLLYPIAKKNYQEDQFIANEWKMLKAYLKEAFMITIFGYSAPDADVGAMKLMKEAWGKVEDRSLEQTEIITKPGSNEEQLRQSWDGFIHTHHYDIKDNFYKSWIANHPRGTGEAYRNQYLEAKFISNNPIPQELPFPELWNWFRKIAKFE